MVWKILSFQNIYWIWSWTKTLEFILFIISFILHFAANIIGSTCTFQHCRSHYENDCKMSTILSDSILVILLSCQGSCWCWLSQVSIPNCEFNILYHCWLSWQSQSYARRIYKSCITVSLSCQRTIVLFSVIL